MFSLYELMCHYNKHKNIIDAYLKGDSVNITMKQILGVSIYVYSLVNYR